MSFYGKVDDKQPATEGTGWRLFIQTAEVFLIKIIGSFHHKE